jgi:polysaccharide pyruvyl transferase WcaK-like protein
MDVYRQWKISILDALRIRKAVLFGVGWWQYQESPNFYTKLLLKSALSTKVYHSVRDSYTQKQLNSIGISNVINTGCPTMWPLSEISADKFNIKKSNSALLMLTDYKKDPELDRKLIELLTSKYESVYFWPQGRGDLEYAKEMNIPLICLDHSFEALKSFVNSHISFDYIGTRLHGGVYCLRELKRSLIIEIDNRAKEIAKDTGLPTVGRSDFQYIEQWIESDFAPRLTFDLDAIASWKSQFSEVVQTMIVTP